MYSIVMLAAMTSAPENPDFCCKGSCCYTASCYGCYGGGGYSKCCFCGGCCTPTYTGCYGCYGGYAPMNGTTQAPPAQMPQGQFIIEFAPPPKKDEPKKKDPMKETSVPSDKAQVVVYLPPDAKLIAEGQITDGVGAERVFLSPSLPEGKDFHYTLKIEYKDGNETKTSTAKLTVRAGHRSEVDFNIQAKSAVTANPPTGTTTASK
jgi:uncharacterized protein (TIGR03000 family)